MIERGSENDAAKDHIGLIKKRKSLWLL